MYTSPKNFVVNEMTPEEFFLCRLENLSAFLNSFYSSDDSFACLQIYENLMSSIIHLDIIGLDFTKPWKYSQSDITLTNTTFLVINLVFILFQGKINLGLFSTLILAK